jgi:magnesium transporter
MVTDPASSGGDHAQALARLLYRDGSGKIHLDWNEDRLREALADREGTLWVDFQSEKGASVKQVEGWLRDIFQFHPLAVEDALQETNVPKVDDWGSYLYIVFSMPRIAAGSGGLELYELDAFLGPNFLVTYHAGRMDLLDAELESITRDPRDRMRQGPDFLLYRILERAVDQSLRVIEQLDEQVDTIQNLVVEHPSSRLIHAIFRVKRSAIRLHKTLGPQRELLNRLARDPHEPIREEHRVYFRDLYDHLVRIHDISESLRDLITGTLETYLTVVSNRTNDIMKILTMVTVMFLPMSFLASFFGMNFFGEPLALQVAPPRGLLFVATCGIMAISPCFMWIYAKRQKWI